MGIAFPSKPKGFGDLFGAVRRFIERYDFGQAEVVADFSDDQRDREVIGKGDKVLTALETLAFCKLRASAISVWATWM